jgi:hypothetical protein
MGLEANLKTRSATLIALFGFLVAIAIGTPDRAMAQAAPGPLAPPPSVLSQTPRPKPVAKPKPPEVPPRKTLDGPWKLNRDESDDPKTKIQNSRGVNGGNGGGRGSGGGNPGGGYPGGGYPGGGYPGGGYPGGGYPGGGGGPNGGQGNGGQGGGRDTETDERLEILITPPTTLSFAVKSAEVELTDDASRRFVFFTDGRKLQKSKDDNYQEIAAHWSGTQLITDEKSPRGAKMSRTFELSEDGRQFFETIHVDRGKSKGFLVVRYVYDVSSGHESELTHETDPDQPVMKRRADAAGSGSNTQGTPAGQGSDPDQPVMKRRSDDSGSTSSPQDTQSNPAPDPDQPVMKRRSGGQ